jgi:hypothetical protein
MDLAERPNRRSKNVTRCPENSETHGAVQPLFVHKPEKAAHQLPEQASSAWLHDSEY